MAGYTMLAILYKSLLLAHAASHWAC